MEVEYRSGSLLGHIVGSEPKRDIYEYQNVQVSTYELQTLVRVFRIIRINKVVMFELLLISVSCKTYNCMNNNCRIVKKKPVMNQKVLPITYFGYEHFIFPVVETFLFLNKIIV